MPDDFAVRPTPDDPNLSVAVSGIDQEGRAVEIAVVTERPLTLFLNAREIVTMMTIGDHPDLLAVGYLLNQNMLSAADEITGVDYDADISTVVLAVHSAGYSPLKAVLTSSGDNALISSVICLDCAFHDLSGPIATWSAARKAVSAGTDLRVVYGSRTPKFSLQLKK